MSFKVRKCKNGESILKQLSPQYNNGNIQASTQQTYPAEVFKQTQLTSLSLTPRDAQHLQSTIGNRSVSRLVTQATKDDFDVISEAIRTPSEKGRLNIKSIVSLGDSGAGMISVRRTGRVAQRFESKEHREIGEEATKGARGEKKTVELAPDYRITFGEMVAMAGDFFEDLNQMRTLANNPGKGAGTREEIEYIRVVKVHGKEGAKSKYSEAARKTADKRYYKLAADNRSHFVNPNKGDVDRSTKDKIADTITKVTGKKAPSGALGYYRIYHVQAIGEAIGAGQSGQGIDSAMAAEAFGGHYLSDMFAAGHLRTARGSISDYWNNKVPMFFHNFKGFVAENLAKYINDHNWRGVASVPQIYEKALTALTDTLNKQGLPDFRFGDLVSGAVHDYDNMYGVKVTSGGVKKTLFGDAHLDEGDTKETAVAAVKAGVSDIEKAYTMAKSGSDIVSIISVLNVSGLFAPEKLVPVVIPDSKLPKNLRAIAWEAEDASKLLNDGRFQKALKLFLDEKKKELLAVGESLDEDYQKEAFKNGVVAKLENEPINTIFKVKNWTPNLGSGASGDADAKAREYISAAKKKKAMKTLTYYQRYNLMVDLLSGPTVGSDEDAIMELLNTADNPTARKLIKEFGWKRLHDEIDDFAGEDFKETFPKSKYGK